MGNAVLLKYILGRCCSADICMGEAVLLEYIYVGIGNAVLLKYIWAKPIYISAEIYIDPEDCAASKSLH